MKGWKTVIFGAGLALFGFLESVDFTALLSEETAGTVISGIGAVVVLLRYLTTSPLGRK
jgi:hypothetical protein